MLEEQLIANLQKFGCGYIIIFLSDQNFYANFGIPVTF